MILVMVETGPDGVDEISLEAVAFARALAAGGDGAKVAAVVVGELPAGRTTVQRQLGEHGVAEVFHVTGAGFASFAGAAWASALQGLQAETSSATVVAAGTPRGNEVLAHLGARLGIPMAANVTSFSGAGPLVVTRQVAGGAALEEMQLARDPAVLTVAGHSWAASPAPSPVDAAWTERAPDVVEADLVARVVAKGVREVDQSDSLKSARVVIGAGRGVGGPDGFGPVLELAELLGGALGVSRVVTSLGWRPHHEQVGQTGSRISPDLYIACGISGAIQHWAGCSSAKAILAINTDPEAPMVTKATYAVIGDMHEVVPAIVEELRRRRG